MGLGLAGRHCFVTGASAGIGRGTALALGAEGALLSIAGRDEDALLVTGDMIVAQGASVLPSLPATCRSLPASTPRLRRSRRLNARSRYNAGGGRPYNLDAPLDAEAWGESIGLNFTAARCLAESALPAMRHARWGEDHHDHWLACAKADERRDAGQGCDHKLVEGLV